MCCKKFICTITLPLFWCLEIYSNFIKYYTDYILDSLNEKKYYYLDQLL